MRAAELELGQLGRACAISHGTPLATSILMDAKASFLPVDEEFLADIQEASARSIRAVVRARPLGAIAGAFASGFLVGGGWRTRLGRIIMLVATRYAVVYAAKRYLGH
jgi:hypothetical protein